jgi:hypothetical protein
VLDKPTYYSKVRGVIVHHTAGSNTYTQAQVPDVMFGIFQYHVKTLKWNDIGYNYLIDKFGGIWEGRAGGITANVQGAHATGFNAEAFGVSVMGNYETAPVPDAVMPSLASLIRWRLGLAGITDLDSTTAYSKIGAGKPVIIGHRDARYAAGGVVNNATTCPGQYLYAKLPELRGLAAAPAAPKPADPPALSGPKTAVKGKNVKLWVAWNAGTTGLTGTVVIERYQDGVWTPHATVQVRDGVGSAVYKAKTTWTFRAMAATLTGPAGVGFIEANRRSKPTVSVVVPMKKPKTTPQLFAPAYAAKGSKVLLKAQWKNPWGRSAKVALQVRRSGKWVKVKHVTISGTRSIRIPVAKTAWYRLKALPSSTPPGKQLRNSPKTKIRVF